MAQDAPFTAFVSWPSAPLTNRLVLGSLAHLNPPPTVVDALPTSKHTGNLLQWSTYDAIDHDLTYESSARTLSSTYTIRKALIRKHYLSRCTHNYLVKHPESLLKAGIPRTWELELSFADELDDMWADELYDLGDELQSGDKWFILKPGMADRGMGIRLFHTKEELEQIFQEFEDSEPEEEDGDSDGEAAGERSTAVATSQLRHFVIQEYLSNPLLFDPSEAHIDASRPVEKPRREDLQGHKSHIRAYCVASGALSLYLYTRMLALFSAVPYTPPRQGELESIPMDLAAHLTNTSLQVERGEAGVRLLNELVGCSILSGVDGSSGGNTFTRADLEDIQSQMADVLGQTFEAALDMSVHFQPVPNAFEMFGIDFLVTHASTPSEGRRFQVKLLEVNSEPAIELTGPRLTWILEELFTSIGKVCVAPFSRGVDEQNAGAWEVGETKEHLRKCLHVNVRGARGW